MTGTLFVHIGSPKTGSTALQDFLFERRAELAAADLSQPSRDVAPERGQEGLRESLFRKESESSAEWRDYYHEYFKGIAQGKVGFVGTEMLWTVNPKRLLEVYPELENIKVITLAVLRRQSELLPTHYKQYIKSGGADEFADFFADRAEHYAYGKLLDSWAKFSELRPLRYSDAKKVGTVRCLMREVLQRTGPEQQARFSEAIRVHEADGIQKSNLSISDSQAFAIRAVNRLKLPKPDALALRNAIIRSRAEFEEVILEQRLVTQEEFRTLILPLERDDEALFADD